MFLTLTQLFSSPTVPFWDIKPIDKMTSAEKWVFSNWMVGFSPVVLDLIFLFGTGSMERIKVSESVLSRDVDPAGKVVCTILGRLRQGLGIAASVIGYRAEPRLVTWDGIVSNVVSPIPDSCMFLTTKYIAEDTLELTKAIKLMIDFFCGAGVGVTAAIAAGED